VTFTVVHVCTGNICRSPMAERLMVAALADRFGAGGSDIEVTSAGTYGGDAGAPMYGPAAQVLRERGVRSDGFTARRLSAADVAGAGLVLTATSAHRTAVLRLDRAAERRSFTLRELARLARELPAGRLSPGTPAGRLAALAARAADLRASGPAVGGRSDDIDDPYGEPLEVFRQVAAEIDAALADVLAPL